MKEPILISIMIEGEQQDIINNNIKKLTIQVKSMNMKYSNNNP